jgi:4-hydroxybenzoate polyprenyltransferase
MIRHQRQASGKRASPTRRPRSPPPKWPTVLYLFTKSDVKTMLLPVVRLYPSLFLSFVLKPSQTFFALVAGPVSSIAAFIAAVTWTWVHLLQFNVSNQCGGVDEDMLNKPWRPIPAGLISLPAAHRLRRDTVILSLALSFMFGSTVTWISLVIAVATYVYNEAHLASHWLGKSGFTAVGYVSFQAGATLIIGSAHVST